MIDNNGALESVIRHASQLDEGDYDDITPTVDALTDSGDITLVPRLHEALDWFLDEENFYGRDLIAGVLAGIAGVAALPALPLAAARDLGDDQDGLHAEIAGLLDDDPAASRRMVLELARNDSPEQRRAGLLALGSVAESGDVELLAEAATDADLEVRLMAIDAIPDPAGNYRAFQVLVAALHDPDEQVRISAISRLGSIDRPDAVAPLKAVAAGCSTTPTGTSATRPATPSARSADRPRSTPCSHKPPTRTRGCEPRPRKRSRRPPTLIPGSHRGSC